MIEYDHVKPGNVFVRWEENHLEKIVLLKDPFNYFHLANWEQNPFQIISIWPRTQSEMFQFLVREGYSLEGRFKERRSSAEPSGRRRHGLDG